MKLEKIYHAFYCPLSVSILLACSVYFLSPLAMATDSYPELNPPKFDGPKRESAPFEDFAHDEPVFQEWIYHKTADNLHPDGNEQQLLWLMNRARSNPTQEGEWLVNTGNGEVEYALDYYHVDTDVLKQEFREISSTPPAAFDVRLYNAAKSHSDFLIRWDRQAHTDQFKRVTDAGFKYKKGRGNVYSYTKDSVHGHAGFNIDWGPDEVDGMQSGRGHRVAVMSTDVIYTNVGIAAVSETNPKTSVGPLVVTSNYCSTFLDPSTNHHNRFLVGTVWSDTNENNQYDPGEGIPGVTVTPDAGGYFAITSNSGGYAIPMESPGLYEVTFSGGTLAQSLKRLMKVSAESKLLDLLFDPNVVVSAPKVMARDAYPVRGVTAVIRGDIETNGDLTYYHFEYGEDGKFDKISPMSSIADDSEVFMKLEGLKLSTKYQYRLVARNSKGESIGTDSGFTTDDRLYKLGFWSLILPTLLNR